MATVGAGLTLPLATAASAATSTISVGNSPYAVAVNPSTNTVYSANIGANSVSVIDGWSNTVTATVSVGSGPDGVAVNPSTNTVYVANNTGTSVSVINGSTNTVTSTVTVGRNPVGVAVNPSTNTVYVANCVDDTVSVINGSTNTVTSTISMGSCPSAVAVNPSTNTVYVTNQNDSTVSVINGSTNAVTSTVSVGSGAVAVAVNPSTNTVYSANIGANSVSVINGSANTVTSTISVGNGPSGVAVNPSTNTVYVTNIGDNTVSVINGSTNAVTSTISVGSYPSFPAVNSSTNTVYVPNIAGNTVSVITQPSIKSTPTTPSISNLPASGTFGGSFTPTVSTTGDGTTSVTSSTTSVCTVDPTSGLVSYVGAGTCTLVAHVAAGTNYSSADGADQSFSVAAVKPSAPGTPALTDNHASVRLSWPAPTSSGGDTVTYNVEVQANHGAWSEVATGLTAPTYTYQGTTAQSTYSFAIVAVNSAGRSAWSTAAWLKASAVKPSVPGTPVLTDNHGSISLSWSAPTSSGGDTVTYKVEELTNHGSWSEVATGLTSPNYTYAGTTAKSTYSFAIVAVNSAGRSAWSTAAWLKASAVKPSVPGTPVLTDNHGSISLSWSAPTSSGGDTVTYKVEELTNHGSWSEVATGLTSPTYTYQGTTANNAYCFAIVAANSAGQSAWSPSAYLRAS